MDNLYIVNSLDTIMKRRIGKTILHDLFESITINIFKKKKKFKLSAICMFVIFVLDDTQSIKKKYFHCFKQVKKYEISQRKIKSFAETIIDAFIPILYRLTHMKNKRTLKGVHIYIERKKKIRSFEKRSLRASSI